MDKRYQVFISSTFRDLVDERREVMQALLEMDCIPAGMELFPAANDAAWTLIKRVIEESDYYCLIIGGRYGSTDSRGLSYTEREFDLAVKMELPILAFLHKNPDEIPAGKVERDTRAVQRLAAFRDKVAKSHHCKYWAGAEDLGGKVSRALIQMFKSNPRIGWVRADQIATIKQLQDYNRLQKRVSELEIELLKHERKDSERQRQHTSSEGLSAGSDLFELNFSYWIYTEPPLIKPTKGTQRNSRKIAGVAALSWDDAFVQIGNSIMAGDDDSWDIERSLELKISRIKEADPEFVQQEGHGIDVERADCNAILTQFVALGLVERVVRTERGRASASWKLTDMGREHLLRIAPRRRSG